MKTYVLTVSRYFPTTHKRKGEETCFVEKIYSGQKLYGICDECSHHDCFHCEIGLNPKIHTIRANYELWAKRIKEVQEGKAILSIRYWSGKPYNSKQVEVCKLDQNSGCGVQRLVWKYNCIYYPTVLENPLILSYIEISKNDGLSPEDFKEWFRGYDLSKPMAIIHFTSFRY